MVTNVCRADCHSEVSRISKSCLWQQASTDMPERTEWDLIVHAGKSEAEVTNNKRLKNCSRYYTVEANYRQTRRIAQPRHDSRASCM